MDISMEEIPSKTNDEQSVSIKAVFYCDKSQRFCFQICVRENKAAEEAKYRRDWVNIQNMGVCKNNSTGQNDSLV